jgi:hypothetical protein
MELWKQVAHRDSGSRPPSPPILQPLGSRRQTLDALASWFDHTLLATSLLPFGAAIGL